MILCHPATKAVNLILSSFPGNYLEIGVFEGESIALLARKHPNKLIYGVDPFIEDGYTSNFTQARVGESLSSQRETAYNNIQDLSNALVFEETSAAFAARPAAGLKALNVSWVLIDGSHHKKDVCIDTELALCLIGDKAGGVIFDDLDLPGVNEAYNNWLARHSQVLAPAFDLNLAQPGHIVMHLVNPQHASFKGTV